MNVKLDPREEYDMMTQFFQTGGSIETMPEELFRVRTIWKRADELVRKYPYYNNEKIAEQLRADFPEFDLAITTAKNHVTNAKKYFDFVETETPATHRRILTTLLYKQIAILEQQQLKQPLRAHQIAKVIDGLANRISSINHIYDQEPAPQKEQSDMTLILSNNSMDFEDIPIITDKELYDTIEKITQVVSISTEEKQKIIDKDVKGKIL